MNRPTIVLDSGVLDRATTDRDFRLLLRDLVERDWDVCVPTVVLAESLSGLPTDAPANQALARFGTEDTAPPTARLAGRLRGAVIRAGGRRTPSGIDAIVAAHAVEAGAGVVFTTDPADLRRLLVDLPRIVVERP